MIRRSAEAFAPHRPTEPALRTLGQRRGNPPLDVRPDGIRRPQSVDLGERGSAALVNKVQRVGAVVRRLDLPEAMDLNDAWRAEMSA